MAKTFQRLIPAVALTLAVLGLSLAGTQAVPASAASPSGNSGGSVWGANYFPDAPLVSHTGKTLRFFSDMVKDKVVIINFVYTSCPDECALETARLAEVQKILGDRVGKDVFMYTITIDPATDTPKVLKGYADKFGAGPGWLFMTGKDADITEIRVKLGLYSAGDKDGKLQDHQLSLIVGNQSTGQWMKVAPTENPYFLANQVGNFLHNFKMPPKEKNAYAQAPALRSIPAGETLFRTRCAACHKIGAQDASGAHSIGPDLLEIGKKRDRGWLVRWLIEPDKMLAEKDPLAVGLLQQYNNLPMPNMRLNGKDAEAVLEFIDQESQRVAHQKEHNHSPEHQHGGQPHEGHLLHEQ